MLYHLLKNTEICLNIPNCDMEHISLALSQEEGQTTHTQHTKIEREKERNLGKRQRQNRKSTKHFTFYSIDLQAIVSTIS